MEAMNYETLIRRVNQCGRHGVKGADADIYRRMERAERYLADSNWLKSKEEKEHDYRISFGEVTRYVSRAIKDGANLIEHTLSEEEQTQLNGMITEIDSLDFYDKKRIEEIIQIADLMFRTHGLKMG